MHLRDTIATRLIFIYRHRTTTSTIVIVSSRRGVYSRGLDRSSCLIDIARSAICRRHSFQALLTPFWTSAGLLRAGGYPQCVGKGARTKGMNGYDDCSTRDTNFLYRLASAYRRIALERVLNSNSGSFFYTRSKSLCLMLLYRLSYYQSIGITIWIVVSA